MRGPCYLIGLTTLLLFTASIAAQNDLDLSAPALSSELIHEINSIEGLPWTAGYNEVFDDLTIGDVVRMLGHHSTWVPEGLSTREELLAQSQSHSVSIPNDLPKEFDGRVDDGWYGCIQPVKDQGKCGSCWAQSQSEAFASRLCIASEGQMDLVLSAQQLVSCNTKNWGCRGGGGGSSASYIINIGLVEESCYNYQAKDLPCPKFADGCPDSDDEPYPMHKASGYYSLPKDEQRIRAEFWSMGPCYMAFDVYEDFIAYKDGVYVHTTGKKLGSHAIHPVGWGTDEASGLDYWLIANSWSEYWGDDGYFKVRLRAARERRVRGVVCPGGGGGS